MTTGYVAGYASDCGCCIAPYQSASFYITCSLPAQPVTSGFVRLFASESGSSQTDVELNLDITPIQDKPIAQAYNSDFTLDIVENGNVFGQLVYDYVSEQEQIMNILMTCNITIYYKGYVYRAENCSATTTYKNPPDGQISMSRTPISVVSD